MEAPVESDDKVLGALDTAWKKFRVFVNTSMAELDVPEVQILEARELLEHDVILFLPRMRKFLTKHEENLKEKTDQDEKQKAVTYFLNLLPPELAYLRDKQIPWATIDRALLFARVFRGLLDDLARNQ